ncbi:MAG: diaminopropionate ammonia-lyase [Acidaminobacteraceae bacterium]
MRKFDEVLGIKAVKTDVYYGNYPEFLNEENIKSVGKFHFTIDGYAETPLRSLDALAEELGVKKIFVKDESYRFGLNSFKVLGGTYAVAKVLSEKLKVDIDDVDFSFFKEKEVFEKIKDMVFITATDGNHGKGLAWSASQISCRSVVYMPKGSSRHRVDAIKEVGGEVLVTDLNYDDTVRLASKVANENGWYLVQDTAWVGYEKIPNWITQGYTTMAYESLKQINLLGVEKPTHIMLQAGVGSMAGSVLGYYVNQFKENCPKVIIMEPSKADCIYKSAFTNDGNPRGVDGDLSTIMAGLACGVPNPLTWSILRDHASHYISCDDYLSELGMKILASPMRGDKKIVSGESGSIGVGLLFTIMKKSLLKDLREDLKLTSESVVLIYSTEGDTDPESYRRVVNV